MTEIPTPTISRRRVLTLTGATLTGGAVVAFSGSGRAQATTEVYSLDIPDATHEGEDGTVSSLGLTVEGSWQYTVDAADEYVLSLMVASSPDADDWQVIDQTQSAAMAASTAGTFVLSGEILDHDQLSADQFSADPSETTTRDVPVAVALDVLHGGEVVVSAIAETTATVEVSSTAVQVSAEVSGSGGVEVLV